MLSALLLPCVEVARHHSLRAMFSCLFAHTLFPTLGGCFLYAALHQGHWLLTQRALCLQPLQPHL